MSLITVIWSMAAAVCLTLATIHFVVWLYTRDKWESLLFCVAAVAAAAMSMQELALMRAQTSAEAGELLRWMHVPAATITIAIVWFIRHYLKAGRLWLAWLISGLRVLVLVPNFIGFPNATFRNIQSLNHISFLGEMVSVPVGDQNPWRILIHASTILFLIYILDAIISAWRQSKSGRCLVLGAAISTAIILAAIFSGLMVRGVLPGPFVGIVFLLVVLAIAFELSMDLIRAGQLSRSLLESQSRMNLAARAASLALWEWNVVRDELWATDVGHERMAALGSEHVGFERYLELVHPDDRDFVRHAMRRTLEGERTFQAEFRIGTAEGRPQWIAAFGQMDRNERGQPLLLRGVSMDVTERKRAESELQKQRFELAHVQRVLALGQLSTALAHELNQPLGAILRNAEAGELMLRQDSVNLTELREIFTDIQQDDQRAVAVIERMQSLLTRRELLYEAVAVDELIGPMETLLRTEIQSRHATLQIDIMHGLPKIHGDRIQLQQVILNLLLNSLDALDANQDKARKVGILASRVNDKMVEIDIVDSGMGIAPERLPRLFEPFFTTKMKGTGVGLAISKTIVEAHGGRIWAENNPDGGAIVRFTLPVAAHGHAV